jgi:hypothetical protein
MSEDDEAAFAELLSGPRMRVHALSTGDAVAATEAKFPDDGELVRDISEMITKGHIKAGRDETGRLYYKITEAGERWRHELQQAQRRMILMTGMEAGLL